MSARIHHPIHYTNLLETSSRNPTRKQKKEKPLSNKPPFFFSCTSILPIPKPPYIKFKHHSSPIPISQAMKSLKLVVAIVLVVVVQLVGQNSEAAITCNDVSGDLLPCVSYLVSGSGNPPSACCDGLKTLLGTATSVDDKKTACNCIKSAAGSINYNLKLAQELPANCGVTLPFPISADLDCSRIS